MKLFIGINLRYKGQVIGTVPDFEHFYAKNQTVADAHAKKNGWDRAIEVDEVEAINDEK